MEPLIFQSLPSFVDLAAAVVLLQIAIILFATNRRFLKWVSVAAVSMIGGIAGAALAPSQAWAALPAGLVGGALLGYFFRPLGVGVALAYIGGSVAAQFVSVPLVQYVVAMDLFAYGLLLTDLAPTVVSTLLASFIALDFMLWGGATAPAAFILASAFGGARLMASLLPPRLALRAGRALYRN